MDANQTLSLGAAGVDVTAIAAWFGVGSAAVVFVGGVLTACIYLARICAGKDVISDCLIGKSRVRIEVDADGNGVIETDKKLVLDLNQKTARGLDRSPLPSTQTENPIRTRSSEKCSSSSSSSCSN